MTNGPRPSSVGLRVKTLRDERRMSQEQLSRSIGFKDRQTLAAIEAGERRIAPDELATAARALGVTVDVLTDPYRLVGEGRFSFRAEAVEGGVLDAFQERAGRWIATYRQLERDRGAESNWLALKLDLTIRSSFEEAQESAEQLVRAWDLGATPAERLPMEIHRKLGALVLYVDAPAGVSGAASLVPGLSTILVNRQEPRGRRSFDLAHELFHILTWDAMPPERVEPWDPKRSKGNRAELLANNFAASLLMPAESVMKHWDERGGADVLDWLNAVATTFGVSAVALMWRIHNTRLLGNADVEAIIRERLVANGDPEVATERPRLFSQEFVIRVHEAVEEGRLSLRRAASLLDLPVRTLASVFTEYGLPLSYDV